MTKTISQATRRRFLTGSAAMLAAPVALGDEPLVVDIRGHRAPARRTHLPFYRNQE